MKIAINSTLKRVIRCSQIMGRSESDALQASQILYPCMQAADIFHLGAVVCQLGMDQRKVNMLAREIGPKLGWWKPVIVSHHMMRGLLPPKEGGYADATEKAIEMKMSKSKPDSAIFMTDSEDTIKSKMKKAYCPEGQIDDNPLMEYARYIIFEKFDTFTVKRPEKFGGDLTFKSYDELADAFSEKKLHPLDLKSAMAEYIDMLIKPVREHFEKDETAKELLEKVMSFQVTR
jgi:tyrosyl-tRNA synthetase